MRPRTVRIAIGDPGERPGGLAFAPPGLVPCPHGVSGTRLMATLLAHITVKPGSEAQFERIAAEMYRRTHADEADPRRYEYWRGAERGTYYCLESFEDYLGFLAH